MIERHPSIEPAHPGEILRDDILPAVSMSKAAMAEALSSCAHCCRPPEWRLRQMSRRQSRFAACSRRLPSGRPASLGPP